jgi:hypothetical protein
MSNGAAKASACFFMEMGLENKGPMDGVTTRECLDVAIQATKGPMNIGSYQFNKLVFRIMGQVRQSSNNGQV